MTLGVVSLLVSSQNVLSEATLRRMAVTGQRHQVAGA